MASVDQALDTANHLARECDTLRRDVERLTKERDEARKLAGLDGTLEQERAYSALVKRLRADVERLTRERDAAYAASLRSDEVHAEAMRAVRGRAEKAEAERDEARAQVERLRGALDCLCDSALLNQCPNDPACSGEDPLDHDEWCGVCLVVADVRAALADAKENEHG